MDYEQFMDMPDTTHMFKTARGSTYAAHSNATTTGYREPSNKKGTGPKIQPRSEKTIYMDPKHVNQMAGLFQNTEMATKFVPIFENGKETGRVALQLTEDYGPKKAGTTLVEAPYTKKPAVGLNIVEVYNSQSPMGSGGGGVHFGNAITEVLERAPAKPSGGGGGGAGMVGVPLGRGANQSGGGGGQPGNLNPMSLQRLMAAGGAIRMPQEYSQGSWKLI